MQHLCYQDDNIKTRTRQLGGIQKLISLILVEMLNVDVYRNACGALRNLSYGRLNDENKLDIKKHGGIHALIRLLKRTQDEMTKENITAVLWNLSSCEDIKMSILDEGLPILVNQIIVPYTATNFSLYQRMNSLSLNGTGKQRFEAAQDSFSKLFIYLHSRPLQIRHQLPHRVDQHHRHHTQLQFNASILELRCAQEAARLSGPH